MPEVLGTTNESKPLKHSPGRLKSRELSGEPFQESDVLPKEGSSYGPNEAAEKGKRDRRKPPNQNCATRSTQQGANDDPEGL